MSKIPTSIPSRGLNIREAAKYFGVSPNTLKKLTRLGLAPAPLKLPGLDRNIYDLVALDAAMSFWRCRHDLIDRMAGIATIGSGCGLLRPVRRYVQGRLPGEADRVH
jgi:hypothetical protein